MQVPELYKTSKPTISFEFFPPKTDDGEKKLFEVVSELKALSPTFISVTYGAMGTTRDNTVRIVEKIKNEIGIEAAAHLTCVGQTKSDMEEILTELKSKNIENIVALRGDPLKGELEFKTVPDGFGYASELVHFIKNHPDFGKYFSLIVGGYPEGHIECRDKEKDIDHLKIKVEEGADLVITQLFFNNDDYFRFLEKARAKGIKVPIVPGIMPLTYGPQLEKFSMMCGASIPKEMKEAISKFGDDGKSVIEFGIEYATKQCEKLLKENVPGLHFYTLNKSLATRRIYKNLGLK